ncbi:MAG: Crp/Fnr family transcriptional regulator [Intestinibacter bartlettii]|uniref:Crp/Fnr family transcriptional regulator n=1 Tax=Intestinibacter bartlettii TaxID=261299 RepID=UPI0039939DC5
MNKLSYYLDTCPDFVKNNFSFEKFNTFDKILVQNEKSDFVYIIIKGKVKVYSLTPTGVKYLERIYCEYEIFGELEAFIDKPILNYVEAIESCNAIKIPKDLFLKWIEIDREFSLYISIQISEKMYYTSINSRANVTYPLKSRLIFFLWNFLDEHNLDTVHKDILVEGVGSNIRSVNRIIKELVNEDLIEYNKGFIKVKNMDKLMDLIMSPNPNKPNFNNQN